MAFYDAKDQARIGAAIDTAVATGQDMDLKLRARRADGAMRDVLLKSRCQYDDKGQVSALFGVIQDITDQLRGLKAAERSRARYQLLADNMADMVARVRLDGSSSYISPAAYDLLGYRPIEMAGRPAQAFCWPEDVARLNATFGEMAAGAERASLEHRALHKAGHPVWVESRFRLIRDETGKPVEMVAVVRDIGSRKAAEAAQAESEARYRLLAEHVKDVIIRTSLKGGKGLVEAMGGEIGVRSNPGEGATFWFALPCVE